MSNIANTVFKNFTIKDINTLIRLALSDEGDIFGDLSDDEIKSITSLEMNNEHMVVTLVINVGLAPSEDSLQLKIHHDGRFVHCNWSGCQFSYNNPIEIYKLIIDRMG